MSKLIFFIQGDTDLRDLHTLHRSNLTNSAAIRKSRVFPWGYRNHVLSFYQSRHFSNPCWENVSEFHEILLMVILVFTNCLSIIKYWRIGVGIYQNMFKSLKISSRSVALPTAFYTWRHWWLQAAKSRLSLTKSTLRLSLEPTLPQLTP